MSSSASLRFSCDKSLAERAVTFFTSLHLPPTRVSIDIVLNPIFVRRGTISRYSPRLECESCSRSRKGVVGSSLAWCTSAMTVSLSAAGIRRIREPGGTGASLSSCSAPEARCP
jgi:hypothetical protein